MTDESKKSGVNNVEISRKRSPNYPSISLEKAIARTTELYSKARTHAVSLSVAAGCWNYKQKSSGFVKCIAACKAYGLLYVLGSGDEQQISVSDIGERIVDGAPDAELSIAECALKPKLYQYIWSKYEEKGLPPTSILIDNLRWDKELGFNKDYVAKFVNTFRATIEYAKLEDVAEDESEESKGEDEHIPFDGPKSVPVAKPLLSKATERMKNFTFPLPGGDVATLQVPHPMKEEHFDILIGIIQAYKPSLVSDKPVAGKGEPS